MIDPQTAPPGTVVEYGGRHASGGPNPQERFTVVSWIMTTGTVEAYDASHIRWFLHPADLFMPAQAPLPPAPVARAAPTPATAPVGSWVEAPHDDAPYLTGGKLYQICSWPQPDQLRFLADDGSYLNGSSWRFLTHSGPAPQTTPVAPPPSVAVTPVFAPLPVWPGMSAPPGYKAAPTAGMFIPADWDAHTTVDLDDPASKTCPVCSIELCPELDTCWDKDAWYAGYCAKCQVKARAGQ